MQNLQGKIAVVDTVTGLVYYINAGHTSPLHLKADFSLQALAVTGAAIGIMPDLTFDIQVIQLAPAESLLIYTDGVTEARNAAGQLYGEARLLALLSELQAGGSPNAETLLLRLNQSIGQFVQTALPSDDLTMCAIYRQALVGRV